jgi:HAD superfamily hydrolase (TIGR01549 family)
MARKILAVCLDCGDTLIDEGTEEKDESGVSLRAEYIPGAAELVHELKRRGYRLALVADGPAATFTNNLAPSGVYALFDTYAISEIVGVSKPDALIFHTAMEQLSIPRDQYHQVVMVGNNLERDIKGANALRMISVWLDWAPRRSKIPADESERPQFTIKTPLELLDILDMLEQG